MAMARELLGLDWLRTTRIEKLVSHHHFLILPCSKPDTSVYGVYGHAVSVYHGESHLYGPLLHVRTRMRAVHIRA